MRAEKAKEIKREHDSINLNLCTYYQANNIVDLRDNYKKLSKIIDYKDITKSKGYLYALERKVVDLTRQISNKEDDILYYII